MGWGLSDLAGQTHLDKGTIHRILASMIKERLVHRHPTSHRYVPGPLLYELGLAVSGLDEFQKECRPRLVEIVKETGGAVGFLGLRSQDEFVCIDHIQVSPFKVFHAVVGSRLPLPMSVFGIAILLALPEQEIQGILSGSLTRIERFGSTRLSLVNKMIGRSLRYGVGVTLGDVAAGISGIGVPIRDEAGRPVASIGVGGDWSPSQDREVRVVITKLLEETRRIEIKHAQLLSHL